MQLILRDGKKRLIKGKEELKFSSFSSYHFLKLTARAKGEKQLGPGATDDEDLTFTLDGRSFPKLNTQADLIDSPTGFSGGCLHDLAKTIYLLIFLKGRNHSLVLNADDPPGTATFEGIEVYTLQLTESLRPDILQQAEDGDRRPWLTFALADQPLKSFSVELKLEKRFIDSDDVKVLVDGKVQLNHRNFWRKLWYFVAASFHGDKQPQTFIMDLPEGLHYVEFHADRMPILNDIVFHLGAIPLIPPGIPTVNNPKWTTDFYDDTEDIILARLIFGEARNQPDEALAGVGWTVRNRLLKKQSYWGYTYHEVILMPYQYSAMRTEDNNFPVLIDPLASTDPLTLKAWSKSYQIAKGVLDGTITDPTGGAVFYHSKDRSSELFVTHDVPGAVFIKQIGELLFYKK